MLKGITTLFLLLNTLMGLGQSNPRDEFNEAKRLMSNQQLRSAMSAFEVLKTDPQLGVYAYFFKGLCYSKNADYNRAIDNWEVIEKEFPNFKFYVALDNPLPEDNWNVKENCEANGDGFKGYIMNVCLNQYLKEHPEPEEIEYYFCGPPAMNASVLKTLDDLGVPEDNIAFDDFGG